MAVIWVIGQITPPSINLSPFVQTNSLTAWIATRATQDTFEPGSSIYSLVFGGAIILFIMCALTNLVIRTLTASRNKTKG